MGFLIACFFIVYEVIKQNKTLAHVMKTISDLPIANGILVTVEVKKDEIEFIGGGHNITVAMNKIIDIEYVSTSKITRTANFRNMGQLIITYDNNGASKNIKLGVSPACYQYALQIERYYKQNYKTTPRKIEL